MEPIAIITLLVLAFGAGKYLDDDAKPLTAPIEQPAVVSVDNAPPSQSPEIYPRGAYALSPNGYYLSNLSPDPRQYPGCETPVLVADLSQPNTQEQLPVAVVNVGCEE
jgi:hypothetical protein